jgi:L-fuculose-phosphate aldolase
LIQYGKKIVECQLVSAHAGTISKPIVSSLLINTRCSMLDQLEGKIVHAPLEGSSPLKRSASSELPMHRGIYRQMQALAVCHGYGRFSIIASLSAREDRVIPANSESGAYLPEIPTIEGQAGTE